MAPTDPPDSIRAALHALAGFTIGADTLDTTLRHISQVAVDAYPAARFAGISVLMEGRPQTAVCTDEEAVDIDATQYETGEGPCLDAFRQGVVHRIEDTETDTRWVAFSKTASRHGIRSTLSLPMIANGEATGALNLYSPRPHGFADADDALGLTLAAQAGGLIANSQIYWDAHQLTETLQEAIRNRAVIEQAKGVIIAANHCTAEEAFGIMVRASQRENRKLRDIAAEVVARAQRTAR